jgi:hypothetical protein
LQHPGHWPPDNRHAHDRFSISKAHGEQPALRGFVVSVMSFHKDLGLRD